VCLPPGVGGQRGAVGAAGSGAGLALTASDLPGVEWVRGELMSRLGLPGREGTQPRLPGTAVDWAVPVRIAGLHVELGGKKVLEDINLVVLPGELVGVVGPNGGGKTTLLRSILGLVPPTRGVVEVWGLAPRRLGPRRAWIGYVPQQSWINGGLPVSVRDVVMTGRLSRATVGRRLGPRDREAVSAALAQVGMEGAEGRLFRDLSGGQKQRVLLARALCRDPRLLVLDEPDSNLDFAAQLEFYRLLARSRDERGVSAVVVSHDLAVLSAHVDKLVCVDRTMHLHGRLGALREAVSGARCCQYDLLAAGRDPSGGEGGGQGG